MFKTALLILLLSLGLTGLVACSSQPDNPVDPGKEAEALRITGWIDENGDLVLRPMHTIQADTFTADEPAGDYLLELQDENRNVLESLQFTLPMVINGEEPMTGPFSLVVPRPAGLKYIVIKDLTASETLGTVTVSENPPTVKILSPGGGESISGTFTVEWEGSDPDDEPLFYTIKYSPDGNEFTVLDTLLLETSFKWDTSQCPGGTNAIIRVIVTDGVNTASDDSGVFTVETKAPEAFILFPEDGSEVFLGAGAGFEGDAYDLEDGRLSGEQLVWSSGIDGVLGTGESIGTEELSVGTHTITLTATDSDGNTGTDSISLTVVDTTPEAPDGLQAISGNQQVTLQWNASTGEYVTGYKVYWGLSSGVYGDDIDVENVTSYTFIPFTPGIEYYFAVTAYDAFFNESGFSTEVQATP